MAQNQGWVCLHRKILDKGWFKNSKYVSVWVHLLLKANHEEKEFMWNGKIMKVKEGQLITGRRELSKETGVRESTLEDILKLFENEQQIQQQKTTKFRLITILNWTKYQEKPTTEQQQSNNRATTKRHKQQCNNINNDNNISSNEDIKLRLPEKGTALVKKDNRNPDVEFVLSLFEKEIGVRPSPMKVKNGFDLNRASADRLVKKYGREGIESMLTAVFKAQVEDKYCRGSTSPYEFEKNLAWYIMYFKKNKGEGKSAMIS